MKVIICVTFFLFIYSHTCVTVPASAICAALATLGGDEFAVRGTAALYADPKRFTPFFELYGIDTVSVKAYVENLIGELLVQSRGLTPSCSRSDCFSVQGCHSRGGSTLSLPRGLWFTCTDCLSAARKRPASISLEMPPRRVDKVTFLGLEPLSPTPVCTEGRVSATTTAWRSTCENHEFCDFLNRDSPPVWRRCEDADLTKIVQNLTGNAHTDWREWGPALSLLCKFLPDLDELYNNSKARATQKNQSPCQLPAESGLCEAVAELFSVFSSSEAFSDVPSASVLDNTYPEVFVPFAGEKEKKEGAKNAVGVRMGVRAGHAGK